MIYLYISHPGAIIGEHVLSRGGDNLFPGMVWGAQYDLPLLFETYFLAMNFVFHFLVNDCLSTCSLKISSTIFFKS